MDQFARRSLITGAAALSAYAFMRKGAHAGASLPPPSRARSRLQCVASRGHTLGDQPNGGGGSTSYTRSETRRLHRAPPVAIANLQFVYGNYAILAAGGGETANPNDLTIESALETTVSPVQSFRMLFRGANTSLLPAGAAALVTDPLGPPLPNGGLFYSRTGLTVPAGQVWPEGYLRLNTAETAVESTNAASQIMNFGALSSTGGVIGAGGFYPLAILGEPVTPFPAALVYGDSLANGLGDTAFDIDNNQGSVLRALAALNIPFIAQTRNSDNARYALPTNAFRKRSLWRYCTHMVGNFGTNDIRAGQTLAQIQANHLTIWAEARAYGLRIYQVLIYPRTTSTDNTWSNAANQGYQSGFEPGGIREQLNAWIRAKALDGTIDGIIDPLPYVADPNDTTKYITNGTANATTTDGIHPTTTVTLSAMAAFTPVLQRFGVNPYNLAPV